VQCNFYSSMSLALVCAHQCPLELLERPSSKGCFCAVSTQETDDLMASLSFATILITETAPKDPYGWKWKCVGKLWGSADNHAIETPPTDRACTLDLKTLRHEDKNVYGNVLQQLQLQSPRHFCSCKSFTELSRSLGTKTFSFKWLRKLFSERES